MTTLVLSRFILNVRRAEVEQALSRPESALSMYHPASPFGHLTLQQDDWDDMMEDEALWSAYLRKRIELGDSNNIEMGDCKV